MTDGDERYGRFKGALAEKYVMNELVKLGLPCYYWRSGNQDEVDFLTEDKGYFVPIEVKSAENTRAKSLNSFISRYKPHYGFRVSIRNVGDNQLDDTIIYSIPLYTLWRIREYIR